jgi:hypothetical protein
MTSIIIPDAPPLYQKSLRVDCDTSKKRPDIDTQQYEAGCAAIDFCSENSKAACQRFLEYLEQSGFAVRPELKQTLVPDPEERNPLSLTFGLNYFGNEWSKIGSSANKDYFLGPPLDSGHMDARSRMSFSVYAGVMYNTPGYFGLSLEYKYNYSYTNLSIPDISYYEASFHYSTLQLGGHFGGQKTPISPLELGLGPKIAFGAGGERGIYGGGLPAPVSVPISDDKINFGGFISFKIALGWADYILEMSALRFSHLDFTNISIQAGVGLRLPLSKDYK